MGGGGGGGGLGNIISSPVQAIGTGIGAIAGGLPGAIGGNIVGGLAGQTGPKAPPPPGMDPQLAALQQKRVDEANQFRQNLPGTTQDMGQNLENQSRRQLAGDIASNNMNANRRGLLGSGLNQAANAQSSGTEATNLANSKQQMTNQLQDQADNMENQAVTNGYQYWQSAKGIQDSAYNAALGNMMSARSGTMALLGGAAKVGSMAAGA